MYHNEVADYYDHDARTGYEERAGDNVILARIRGHFRELTLPYVRGDVLEIGCGPGYDVCWLASRFPGSRFTALDISPEMVELTRHRIAGKGVSNAKVLLGDAEHLQTHFSPESMDLVYVYFGALNTVEDLNAAAAEITGILKPGGTAVLTWVNKWYLRELLVQLLKLKPRAAMARLRKTWGGYSTSRFLPSRCYSPGTIINAFSDMECIRKHGYSIVFPAWYNAHKITGNPEKADRLWKLDQMLQKTPFWSCGEYTLFIFQKPL